MNIKHTIKHESINSSLEFITTEDDSYLVLAHAAKKQQQSPAFFSIEMTITDDVVSNETIEDLQNDLDTNW